MSQASNSSATESDRSCRPVIIVGPACCGGENLRDVLAALPQFATWSFDDLSPLWRLGRSSLGHDELGPELADDATRRAIRSEFGRLAKRSGCRWVVEYTSGNALRIDFVQRVLPEAKFLFLVRDGRNAITTAIENRGAVVSRGPIALKDRVRYTLESLGKLFTSRAKLPPHGPRFRGIDAHMRRYGFIQTAAEQWASVVEDAADRLEQLSELADEQGADELVLPLTYESIVADPVSEVLSVCDFVGLDVDVALVARVCQESFRAIPTTGKVRLDEETRSQLSPVLDELLAEYGYGPCRPPSESRRAA